LTLEEPKLKAEPSETSEATPAPEPKLSPVYSVDIQSDGLWALSGLENGSINLVTVRHDEGKCHHVFWKHAAPVSILSIMPGERSFISGSWDKTIVVSFLFVLFRPHIYVYLADMYNNPVVGMGFGYRISTA
jgi:transcriptional activator SPT8